MANKRKRDDLGDSDSDEITPGRQILPVANLPYNFDQEPQDGMQYLFLVRRDARRLPHVTRVRNPYEVVETKVAPTRTPLSTSVLPCDEWRIAFRTHFSNLRMNLTQTTIHVGHDSSGRRRRAIPEKKDRDAWWKFLAGYPESAWGPVRKISSMPRHVRGNANAPEVVQPGNASSLLDVHSKGERYSQPPLAYLCDSQWNATRKPSFHDVQTFASASPSQFDPATSFEEEMKESTESLSPPEVTPSHLREIDHRVSIHLLMYFTHWINVHLQNPNDPLTIISASHGRWIFALLIKIEDQLSADEMNLLRNLARACLGFIQRHSGKRAKSDTSLDGISSSVLVENTARMSDASCWMIFAAIAGYWGQRDLWADAETTLTSP